MKRIILCLLAFVFTISCLLVIALGEDTTSSSKLALDLVIVIDMSNSMPGINSPGNDARGYRLDAAAMLLGLCDGEHSRAGIVLFAGDTLPGKAYYPGRMLKIKLGRATSDREEIIEEIDHKYRSISAGDTNLGAGLMTAVKMLKDDPSDNTPVIVLLTDGQIEMKTKAEENKSIEQFDAAVTDATEMGIRIYTVALKPLGKNFSTDLIKEAADRTGGVYNEVTRAEDIPALFNSFFANQVGSEVVEIKGNVETEDNGSVVTTLHIPNHSVSEANVLIPAGERFKGFKVELEKDGKPRSFDNFRYVHYVTQNSTFIKVVNPQEIGDWVIRYSSQAKDMPMTDVSINVVFSYDVVPVFSFDHDTVNKTDNITSRIRFAKPDGNLTDDTALYTGGIVVKGNIIDSNGTVVSDELTFAKTEEGFTYTGRIDQLIPRVKDGEYRFRIHLKGDGMDTETVSQSFRVKNRNAKLINAGESPSWIVTIHDPTVNAKEEYEKEQEITFNMDQFVADPDGEKLVYTLKDYSSENALFSAKAKGSNITLKTKDLSGRATLQVEADDGDADGKSVFSIPITVNNVRQEMRDKYSFNAVLEGNTAAKHETITCVATVLDGNQPVTDPAILKLIADHTNAITAIRTYQGVQASSQSLQFAVDGALLKGTFVTENTAGDYSLTGGAKVFEDIKIEAKLPKGFKVANTAPTVKQSITEDVETCETIHDPTLASGEDFERIFEKTYDLRKIFEDPDGDPATENDLHYQVKVADGQGNELDGIAFACSIDEENDTLTVTSDWNGKAIVTVTALDGEEDSCEQTLSIEIDNRKNYMADHFRVEVKREGDGAYPAKNSEYTYVARVYEDINQITDQRILQWVDLSDLKVQRAKGEENFDMEALDFVQENDLWRAAAHTVAQEREYLVIGTPKVRGTAVSLNPEEAFKLENVQPKTVKGKNTAADLAIFDPTRPEDAEAEPKVSLNLSTFFADDDGEKLTYSVELLEGSDIVAVKLDNKDTGVVTLTTKGKSGTAKLKAIAQDESDGTSECEIPVRVTNVLTDIEEEWKLGFEMVSDEEGKTELETGDNVVLHAKLDMSDTPALQGSVYPLLLKESKLQVSKQYRNDDQPQDPETLKFEYDEKADELIASYTLDRKDCVYYFSGDMKIAGTPVKINQEKKSVSVGNMPPVLHPEIVLGTDTEPGYPADFTVHPFLWGKKDEATFDIHLKELLTDSPKDPLKYYVVAVPAPVFGEELPDIAGLIENAKNGEPGYEFLNADEETGELTLQNDVSGDHYVLLYATDSTGESRGIVYQYKVISQKEDIIKLLAMCLAGLILLIIIILLIYWRIYRKRWTPQHGAVAISVNGAPKPTNAGFPKSGRKEVSMNILHVTNIANDPNMKTKLSNLEREILFRAGKDGVVQVRRDGKKANDFAVSVSTKNLAGSIRKADWHPNTSMKLVYTDPTTKNQVTIDIKRVQGNAAGGAPGAGFGPVGGMAAPARPGVPIPGVHAPAGKPNKPQL